MALSHRVRTGTQASADQSHHGWFQQLMVTQCHSRHGGILALAPPQLSEAESGAESQESVLAQADLCAHKNLDPEAMLPGRESEI